MGTVFLIRPPDSDDAIRAVRKEMRRSEITVRDAGFAGRDDSPPSADLPPALLSADAVVLAWSAWTDASFFAHWLWTAALARGKPVFVLPLDDTPLPAELKAAGVPSLRDPRELAAAVRAALKARSAGPPDGFEETRADRFFSRWEARASLVAAALAIVAFGFDLPGQIAGLFHPRPPIPVQRKYPLAGLVWDEKGRPLPGVVVRVADRLIAMSDTTDPSGRFSFEVPSDAPRQVNLVAEKDGYEPYNLDPALDTDQLEFVMRRAP